MKEIERKIIQAFSRHYPTLGDFAETHEMSPYDFECDYYIVEIKSRNKRYDPWIIERVKVDANTGIAESLKKDFFKDEFLINRILLLIEKFLKVHIKNQIDNGANVIQIFDSWAGLLEEKDLPNYVYSPTLNLVNYVKSLNVPVICFPREIKNYKEFCDIVKPDAVSIDYNVDPKKILRDIKIPIQGGLDPKILLTDKETLKKEASKYLEIFKDHPYIFNLGHGILPETSPEMVENLIKIVKDFK